MTHHGNPGRRATGKWRPWSIKRIGGKGRADWFMPWFMQVFSRGSGPVGAGLSVKACL